MYKKIRHTIFAKREYLYLLPVLIGVYYVAIRFVDGTKSLSIYGDELGYWQGAAFFLGIDWSEIASVNDYYGCGYGLFLAPIMAIWKGNSAVMMQMAVRMQGALLASCVFISYKCINMIAENLSCLIKIIISTVTILYPCNLLFVNIVLSECILNWCIWILFFLYLKYEREDKTYQLFLILILSVYIYLIHARTIAVLIAMIFVFFLVRGIHKMQIERKKLFFDVVLFFLLILTVVLIKQNYMNTFPSERDQISQNGNLVAQVSNVIYIATSFNRIIDVLYSVCGKLYYILIGSFFFVGFGILMCIKIIVNSAKKKEAYNGVAALWLIIVFIFACGIDSLYMSSNFESRSDILIYGRYLEYVCGPIILLGILYLFQEPKSKYIGRILFVGLLLSIFVKEKMPSVAPNSNIWVNCSAIARAFFISENNKTALLFITLSRCLPVFILLSLCQLRNQKYKIAFISILISIGAFWILQFNMIWTKNVVPWRDDIYEKQNELLALVEDNSFGLYDATYLGFFQFQKVESKVYVFQSIEECINNENIHFIISDLDCNDIEWITENANIIRKNSRYILWNTY